MKPATISHIKQELKTRPAEQLLEICLRLAKYKVENKELLSYLLFESESETSFIKMIKEEMEEEFLTINSSNLYFAKKSIRRLLRNTNKYIRFSKHKTTEVELRVHFCKLLRNHGFYQNRDTVMDKLYHRQIESIKKILVHLNEDLQFDYKRELEKLC